MAAINQFWADGLGLISSKLDAFSITAMLEKANEAVLGKAWMGRTVQFTWDPIFIAAGALTGLRVSASMMLGGTLCWAVFVPILQYNGITTATGYKDLVKWTLWGGVACMVTSGLLSFALQWRSVLRAFSNLGDIFRAAKAGPRAK